MLLSGLKYIPNDAVYLSALTLSEIRKGIKKIKDHSQKKRLII